MKDDKILEKSQEILDKIRASKIVANKFIPFEYDNLKYRVVKPTVKDSETVQMLLATKYNQLLDEVDKNGKPVHKTEAELIKIHKRRGLDLEELDSKIEELSKKFEKKQIEVCSKLDSLTKDQEAEEIKILEEMQDNLNAEANKVTLTKVNTLGNSIEYILNLYSYKILASLITEKQLDKEQDTWEKAFKSFDEFDKIEGEFSNLIIGNIRKLLGNQYSII